MLKSGRGLLVGICVCLVLSGVLGQVINTTDCGDGITTNWATWQMWGGFGACSVSCVGETGEVSRQRSRTCPVTVMTCDAEQFEVEVYECMGTDTTVNGGYGHWTQWADAGTCSVKCGTGLVRQTRTRQCDDPPPSCGGTDCRGLGDNEEGRYAKCFPDSCGATCSRYSPVTVLANTYHKGTYLLCYRGSIYERPCPKPYDRNGYYTYGQYNARIIYRVCSFW